METLHCSTIDARTMRDFLDKNWDASGGCDLPSGERLKGECIHIQIIALHLSTYLPTFSTLLTGFSTFSQTLQKKNADIQMKNTLKLNNSDLVSAQKGIPGFLGTLQRY